MRHASRLLVWCLGVAIAGSVSAAQAPSNIPELADMPAGTQRLAPVLLTADMVAAMAPGSVIVDISIDQGGNCALTEPGGTCVKHGVTIEGIKNIPGLLPTSSTWMFARNMYHLVKYLVRDGRMTLDRSDEIVAGIVTTIDGKVVHEGALEAMGGKA